VICYREAGCRPWRISDVVRVLLPVIVRHGATPFKGGDSGDFRSVRDFGSPVARPVCGIIGRWFTSLRKSPQDEGSLAEAERQVAQDNPAASKWKEFYRKIETRGESEAEHPRDETDKPIDNLSDEEAQDVIAKLNHLRHQYFVPRMLQSVMDQVFYVVESTRHNLKYERRLSEWRASAAFEMYQF